MTPIPVHQLVDVASSTPGVTTSSAPITSATVAVPAPVPAVIVTVPDLLTPSSLQTLALEPPSSPMHPATSTAVPTTAATPTGTAPSPTRLSNTRVARPPATPAKTTAPKPSTSTPTRPPAKPAPRPVGPSVIPVPYKHPLGWVSGGKVVSLTFDDGPSRYTGQILDVLDRYHVKATFCQIGQQVGSFPAVETRIGADGHTLCNHTWTHDEALPAKSVAVIDAQISRTQTAIRTATGSTPRYYRAPGGDFGTTPKLPGQLARFHTIPLAWAVDSVDWRKPGVAAIVKNVVSAVTPGAIIVMHDGGGDRTQTLAALPKVITALHAKGYSFIVLPRNPQL